MQLTGGGKKPVPQRKTKPGPRRARSRGRTVADCSFRPCIISAPPLAFPSAASTRASKSAAADKTTREMRGDARELLSRFPQLTEESAATQLRFNRGLPLSRHGRGGRPGSGRETFSEPDQGALSAALLLSAEISLEQRHRRLRCVAAQVARELGVASTGLALGALPLSSIPLLAARPETAGTCSKRLFAPVGPRLQTRGDSRGRPPLERERGRVR